MKNALILHGTDDNPQANWFPWLKTELEKKNYHVWLPHLPQADRPNISRYNKVLLHNDFDYQNAYIIGHSSGAVAALGLLQKLPDDVQIDTCIMVGSFKDDLGWEVLKELFLEPFDFEKIKKHAKKFILVHATDDPYCPLEHAQYLSEKLNGELIILPDQKHFSTGTAGEKYRKFPFLLDLIR
jgi:predicted alpha/beta hydrolase family esterase